MEEKLNELQGRLAEVSDLRRAAAVLEWDQHCYMPPAGGGARADQIATLYKIAHEIFVADETGTLLADVAAGLDGADPDGDLARLVLVSRREFDRARRVPARLVAEMARAAGLAHEAWVRAKAAKDFAQFAGPLERILELKRQMAACFGPQDSPYDPLLDEYEPGMRTARLKALFAELRQGLVPLVQAIAGKPETDDSILRQPFAEQQQWDFGLEVIRRFGYDFARGRQDKAPHPFCTTFGPDDVRLTARVRPDYLPTYLMGAMHESGHGMYEQGLPAALARTPLFDSASLGMHESQSRLWENLIGRSLGFWRFQYPRLQAAFPQQLGGVGLEAFYRALNKVKPSFNRVEADEVTYNLHVMLRFELEVDLLEERLQVRDLPAAWNAKFRDYLGLEVPDDSLGALQDVHWSMGLVGYFATYSLGNLIAVMFFDQAVRDVPVIPQEVERGEFGALLGWLRENVHQHGRKFMPDELIQKVTGRPLEAGPYLAYLRRKYTDLYRL